MFLGRRGYVLTGPKFRLVGILRQQISLRTPAGALGDLNEAGGGQLAEALGDGGPGGPTDLLEAIIGGEAAMRLEVGMLQKGEIDLGGGFGKPR